MLDTGTMIADFNGMSGLLTGSCTLVYLGYVYFVDYVIATFLAHPLNPYVADDSGEYFCNDH